MTERLILTVMNAGQRVGSMCLPNTEIIVEGSTSADVGWLNSGGIITVKGDAGDTAGIEKLGGYKLQSRRRKVQNVVVIGGGNSGRGHLRGRRQIYSSRPGYSFNRRGSDTRFLARS